MAFEEPAAQPHLRSPVTPAGIGIAAPFRCSSAGLLRRG